MLSACGGEFEPQGAGYSSSTGGVAGPTGSEAHHVRCDVYTDEEALVVRERQGMSALSWGMGLVATLEALPLMSIALVRSLAARPISSLTVALCRVRVAATTPSQPSTPSAESDHRPLAA